MKKSLHGVGRIALYAGVVGALCVPALPATTHQAFAQGASQTINGHVVSGRFLQVWQSQGSNQNSVYVNGLPITDARPEINVTDGKTYNTQWFERARYEAHPENQAPYDVLLGLLGVSLTEGRGSVDPATKQVRNPSDAAFVGIDKPADVNGTTKVWFQETRHSVSGKILEYWNKYGGLKQFGFPLSEQFQEISATDGKTYTVQYFERNRFELHPENADPYAVELGLLGVQQYKLQPVPAAQLPIAPAPGTTSSKTSMVVGSQQEPSDLTPFNNAAITTRISNLFTLGADGGLVNRDEEGRVFPQVAWYVPTLENGGAYYVGTGDDRHLVVKYKLRPGIKWSDGVEVTSNDAVFQFQLVMNPDTPAVSRSEFQKLQNLDNPDKYTVIYNYRSLNQTKAYYNSLPNKGDYGFLKVYIDANKGTGSLIYSEIGGILPKHVLQNINPKDIRSAPYAKTPIGIGPWNVKSWDKGQQMVLVANPNYNLTAPPAIKQITIKFINDPNQLLSQVETGDVDLVFGEAFNTAPVGLKAVANGTFKIVTKPATTWEHLDFDFRYAPFQDVNVRRAIMMGINRKRISDVVYNGSAGVLNTVVPTLAFHSLENVDFAKNFPDLAAKYKLPNNDYNPDQAKKLLDQAGWVVGGDGIRAKNGVKLSFEYGTTDKATRKLTAPLVSADLKAIGVDAQVKFYGADPFFNGDNTDPRATGQTKLAEFAYIGAVDSDFSSWTCDQKWNPQTFAGVNEQQYCNPDLDRLNGLYNLGGTNHDIADASAQAQVLIANQVVVVPLVNLSNIEVVRSNLQNFKETNSQYASTFNALQWYFK
jgi:peptide/nickel transport system substrate-binding protein